MSEQNKFDSRIFESEILAAIQKFESNTGIAVSKIEREFLWSRNVGSGDMSIVTTNLEVSYVTRRVQ